jgi:hypothetical protein
MAKPQHARLKSFAAASLVAIALVLFAAGARAQSRHAPRTPPPTPTPEATPQGESESKPRASSVKSKDVLVSFVVTEYSNAMMGLNTTAVNDLTETFARRLGQSASVSVTRAGNGSRADARKRAKEESEAYVVLFQVEEDMGAGTGTMGGDTRSLTIKTYVYAPKTGDLKYMDTIYQRPYRQMATIGGIPVPVQTRRIEQYPSQLQLEQASRDAADHLLSRFNIMSPQN